MAAVLASVITAAATLATRRRRRRWLRALETFQEEPGERVARSTADKRLAANDELLQERIEALESARREVEQLKGRLSSLEEEVARVRELRPALADELLVVEGTAERVAVLAEEEAEAVVWHAEAEARKVLRAGRVTRDELHVETLLLRSISDELRSNSLGFIAAAAAMLDDVSHGQADGPGPRFLVPTTEAAE